MYLKNTDLYNMFEIIWSFHYYLLAILLLLFAILSLVDN